ITAALMTNVFALNMFYDVPVKLYSFHLLVTSLVIAAPDLGGLFRFMVLQKPISPPTPAGPVFSTHGWRIVSWIGKGFVLALLSMQARLAYAQYAASVVPPAVTPPVTRTYRVDGVTYKYPTRVAWHLLTGTYRVVGFP